MSERLPPYRQRVVQEHQELEEKYCKLTSFIATKNFDLLQQRDKELLIEQESVMHQYMTILEQRIARFT